ncbi:MAG: glycine oxidase ThiO [Gammaproteobacteria bacterium]|nr:glycine oxidase ThiO [Gammaproteobacteria bacterium]
MDKVCIIGAGIIGMLTAKLLAEQGVEVHLIEQGYAGKESSWAGGGIISPLYPWRYDDSISVLAQWGQAQYPQLLAQLNEKTGIDPEYQQSGLLYLSIEEELSKAQAWMNEFSYSFEALYGEQLSKTEKELNNQFQQGWLTKSIGQVRNPRLVKSMQKLMLISENIHLHEQTRVTELIVEKQQVKGVKTESTNGQSQSFYADRVIVAGGAWTAKLLDNYQSVPRIAPVKGQMIVFKAPENLIQHIVLSKGRYLIPRKDGRIVLGSTLEFNQFDKTIDDDTLEELRLEAIRIVPELANYEVEKQWAGLRPGSIDGIPYVGEHPELKHLYLNAGHFRNGIVIGYASCELLKNMLLEQECILDPRPYALTANRLLASSEEVKLEGAY